MNAQELSLRLRPPAAPSPAQFAARLTRFRINFLNRLIRQNNVSDAIMLGTDHRLARRLKSPTILAEAAPAGPPADLAISVDVIDWLAGDEEFNAHLRNLFAAARRYVVIHGRDARAGWGAVAGRRFTIHVSRFFPAWHLAAHVPSPFSPAAGDFFVYARAGFGCVIPLIVTA